MTFFLVGKNPENIFLVNEEKVAYTGIYKYQRVCFPIRLRRTYTLLTILVD
jgi:hypothetical protein